MQSDKQKWFEIIAVLITGILKFVLMDWLNLRFIYISGAIFFWMYYVILRSKRNKGILKDWGFTRNNFKKVFIWLLPVTIICISGFGIYAWSNNIRILNWHILPILIVYPIWGVVQQFMIIGLIAGNLQTIEKIRFKRFQIIILTAIIFSIVHFPSILLMIGTFILAIAYIYIFLKWRNLWVLGIYHGWIGCFFFYYVLQRDAFAEVFMAL